MIYGNQPARRQGKKGFTLLELLIVIAILAILATVLVLVLNPAETLRKSRDTQRVSDLATMKTAIGLYVTTINSPQLDNTVGNTTCKNGSGTDTIYYSLPSDAPGAPITDVTLDGGSGGSIVAGQVTNANLTLTNGSGWVKVNFGAITGGSPISGLPTDPTNTITVTTAVADTDLVYRYMCDSSDNSFEFDANLESAAYATAGTTDNKEERDGGNNPKLYEAGTKLSILGIGQDF